jgi:hypothetical protein
LSENLIKESRRLRRNLFIQGDTRHLSDKDFQNYKSASINNCIRSEADLISPVPNDIDGVVDLNVLKNLKNFSFTIKDLEERILELTATPTTTPTPTTAATQPPPSKPSSAVTGNLGELTKKIAEYIEEIMPPQFLQSMLIIPKDQLHKYKLHKVVLLEYNEYIQETCQVVHDISNKLSTHISYTCTKNIKRKSKNSFPSFKNKLNELLLKYAEEFGFVEDSQKKQLPHHHHHHHQQQQDNDHHHHYHQQQQQQSKEEQDDHHHHQQQQQQNKKQLKTSNRKKIRYMKRKLFEEYQEFKKENPDNEELDLKEYPPVEIKIGSKNKDLKSVDSFFLHYNMQNFKIIEGNISLNLFDL